MPASWLAVIVAHPETPVDTPPEMPSLVHEHGSTYPLSPSSSSRRSSSCSAACA